MDRGEQCGDNWIAKLLRNGMWDLLYLGEIHLSESCPFRVYSSSVGEGESNGDPCSQTVYGGAHILNKPFLATPLRSAGFDSR